MSSQLNYFIYFVIILLQSLLQAQSISLYEAVQYALHNNKTILNQLSQEILFESKALPDPYMKIPVNVNPPINSDPQSSELFQKIFERNNFPTFNKDARGKFNNPQQSKFKLIDSSNHWPVMSYSTLGKGLVIIMTGSKLFTDQEMGSTLITPNSNQLRIYKLEYWLFTKIMQIGKNKDS